MNTHYEDDLAAALAQSSTADEIKNLLMVIMAKPEYDAIEQRYEVLKMLQDGASYTEIVAKTGSPSIMVSRIENVIMKSSKL